VPSTSGPQPYAAGPVVSEGRNLARRRTGLEIQGPECAFENSMFLCLAVHMSTRDLLRSSSTHEPSDPPFRVMSMVAEWRLHHQFGPIPCFFIGRASVLPLRRSRLDAARDAQRLASSFKAPLPLRRRELRNLERYPFRRRRQRSA